MYDEDITRRMEYVHDLVYEPTFSTRLIARYMEFKNDICNDCVVSSLMRGGIYCCNECPCNLKLVFRDNVNSQATWCIATSPLKGLK